jgi:hypothetical protein
MFTTAPFVAIAAAAAILLSGTGGDPATPDVATIIQRSMAASQRNWAAAPHYNFVETDREKDGTRTYQVTMMLGSPYERLLKVNGQPLSAKQEREEQQKFDRELANRRSESPDKRASRTRQYQRERERDHVLLSQLSSAFDFSFVGRETVNGHDTYVLRATPRAGYKPPNAHAEALTGMRGQLWIDTKTFNWVKVSAEVVHPVAIAGFLARVEPGTAFELEEMPVGGGIWLPKHFSVQSRSAILFVFNHRTHDDETYSDYQAVTAAAR